MIKNLFILNSLFLIGSIQADNASPQTTTQSWYFPEELVMYQMASCRETVKECSNNNASVLKMFDETVELWHNHYLKKNLDFDILTLFKAVNFSAVKHKGQFRKDAGHTPYLIHTIGVARSLWEEGKVRSVNVLVAALLHDTLEDTDTTADEIETHFGSRVRYTVNELTNDPNLSTEENKQRQVDHAPHLSLNAQLVKLADRLYNVRDLRNPPPTWDQEKVAGYRQWAKKLLHALQGTNEPLEQALEAEITAQSTKK